MVTGGNAALVGLADNYDPNRIPVNVNETEFPLVVSINLCLNSLLGLDEHLQVFSVAGWLELSWKDDLLDWDMSDERMGYLQFAPSDVWVPDITIYISVEQTTDIQNYGSKVRFNSSGHSRWYPGARQFKTRCSIDVRKYPFDSQKCTIQVGSWLNEADKLVLKPIQDTVCFIFDDLDGEWLISETRVSQHLHWQFSVCDFELTLSRQPSFLFLTMIVPILLLSALNVLVFTLPVGSGERMTLCISVLLSFAIFQTILAQSLPHISTSMSYLVVFLCFQNFESSLTVTLTVLVIKLHLKGADKPIPRFLEKICALFKREEVRQSNVSENDDESMDIREESKQTSVTWTEVAEFIDRWCFRVFSITTSASVIVLLLLLLI